MLLLEAGPDYPTLDELPQQFRDPFGEAIMDPEWSWMYRAVISANGPGALTAYRGRVIGGSSATNGGFFMRGIPEDYDSWGADQWTFSNVLPYFRKLEHDLDFSDEYHATDGPIPVARRPYSDYRATDEAFFAAALASGFPEKPDANNPAGHGVSRSPRNVVGGMRVSTAIAYLMPARGRANLTVIGEARVTKINFDGRRAVGVEGDIRGAHFVIEGGEVILCAGAIASPQLLMLSGIGPAADLHALGIEAIVDLPGVGQNLRDHPYAAIEFVTARGCQTDPRARAPAVLIYTAEGSDWRNDMQIASPAYKPSFGTFHMRCHLDLESGAGQLRLTSANARAQPLIEFHYWEEPSDRRRMRDCLRTGLRLLQERPFDREVVSVVSPSLSEGCSDDALDAWVLAHTETSFHTCGTCRMGRADDPMVVVDGDCKVLGTGGLRVADLSVVPHVIRPNTHATAIMIGERAADLVLTESCSPLATPHRLTDLWSKR